MLNLTPSETFTIERAEFKDVPQLLNIERHVYNASDNLKQGLENALNDQSDDRDWVTKIVSSEVISDYGEYRGQQRIVGFAKWSVDFKNLDRFQGIYDRWIEGISEKERLKNFDRVWGGLAAYLRHQRTEMCAWLDPILILPSYQRQGLGRQLLEHELKELDDMMIPCYLQPSVPGEGLYTRLGFEYMANDEELEAVRKKGDMSRFEAFKLCTCMVRAIGKEHSRT